MARAAAASDVKHQEVKKEKFFLGPSSDDETERETAAKAKARVASSRLPFSPPSTSSSSSSRKLTDDLSDFIAIFHAAKQKRERDKERDRGAKVSGDSGARKWFAQLGLRQRQVVLSLPLPLLDSKSTTATITTAIPSDEGSLAGHWALLLYEMLLLREEKGCDRFLFLGDIFMSSSASLASSSASIFDTVTSPTSTPSAAAAASKGKTKAKAKGKNKNSHSGKKKKKSANKNKKKSTKCTSSSVRNSTWEEVEEQKWNVFRDKVKDSLCWKRSSDVYKRVYRGGHVDFEQQLEEHCYLYSTGGGGSLFDSFAIDEDLLGDIETFYSLCDQASLGQFLSGDKEEERKRYLCVDGNSLLSHETEWLVDMGYYTISAFVVSRVEMAIRKAYRSSQHKGQITSSLSSVMESSSRSIMNKRETFPSKQQELVTALSRKFLARQIRSKAEQLGSHFHSNTCHEDGEDGVTQGVLGRHLRYLGSLKECVGCAARGGSRKEEKQKSTMLNSGRLYLSRKPDLHLDRMLLISQHVALGVVTKLNEALLLEELDKEAMQKVEEEEQKKKKKKIKKEKKDKFKQQQQQWIEKQKQAEREKQEKERMELKNSHKSGGEPIQKKADDCLKKNLLEKSTKEMAANSQKKGEKNQEKVKAKEEEKEEEGVGVFGERENKSVISNCVKPEEEERWMEGAVPPEADFSWANIFGTQPGASFYWSSGDLNMYKDMQNFERDGSEISWTSSTRQEFVLGSLLSNLEQNDVLSSPERKSPLGIASTSETVDASQALERFQTPSPDLSLLVHNRDCLDQEKTSDPSSDHVRPSSVQPKGPRSETNSPRFSSDFSAARRPSLELSSSVFSASTDRRHPGNAAAPGGMGRWLLQRRSSEVMLLSRAEPANSATSFLMSSAPPRSLLRTMLNAFGPPSSDSPYRSEYNERKAFWQEKETASGDFPLGLKKLNQDIDVFVNKVLENQRLVSRHQREAMSNILEAIHVIWPRARAKVFGSVAAGLSLPGSDMDIVLWLPPVRNSLKNILEVGILESGNETKESFVQQLARHLKTGRYTWINQDSLRVIDKTAIPILSVEYLDLERERDQDKRGAKAKEPLSSFRCSIDISFQNKNHKGVLAAAIVRELTSIFPQLASLTYVLKAFLQGNNLSKAYTGGLSSYCLTLIISSFLIHHQAQEKKKKKKKKMKGDGVNKTDKSAGAGAGAADHPHPHPHGEGNETTASDAPSIGQLLLDFLHFFGNAFNTRTFSCSLSKGISRISEDNQRFDPIFVEDPLQPGKNAAQNCFRITQIQNQMQKAYSRAEDILLAAARSTETSASASGTERDCGDLLNSIFRCKLL